MNLVRLAAEYCRARLEPRHFRPLRFVEPVVAISLIGPGKARTAFRQAGDRAP
jgi:hypothetical protein